MGRMAIPLLLAAVALGAIDPAGFNDSRSHWRNINQPERVMQAIGKDQPAYRPEQVREIAANLLLFQRDNGGWPKDYDMRAILTEAQQKLIRDTHANHDTSFDNHNVHPQVDYLARAFAMLGDPAYRAACERGFDFMLAAQYANGGFPQRWPKPSGIGARITLNDGVMMGIMNVLYDAANGAPHFAWLDGGRRERARAAVARGGECLLRMQIPDGAGRSGWGQQHDQKTLETVGARTFELPCVSPADTVEVVRFLMRDPEPAPAMVTAIETAVAWLQKVQLNGVRVQRIAAPPAEFFRHHTDFDVVVVPDEKAPPLWARTVEPGTNRPIFASRDGVKVYSLAEVDRERRTGSGWYVTTPQALLTKEYPSWRTRVTTSPTK